MEERQKSIKILVMTCTSLILVLLLGAGIYMMNMPKTGKEKTKTKYDKSIYGEYIFERTNNLSCPYDKLYLKEDGNAYYDTSDCKLGETKKGKFTYEDGIIETTLKYNCSDLKSGKYYEPDNCDGTINENPDGTISGELITFKIDVANKKIIYIGNDGLRISASGVKAAYKWKKLPDVMPICGQLKEEDYDVETSELILFKDGTYTDSYQSPCGSGGSNGTYEEKDGKLILTCKSGQCDKGKQYIYTIGTTGLVEVSGDMTASSYTKVSYENLQLVKVVY